MQDVYSKPNEAAHDRRSLTPEDKRETLVLLSRTVAHLYALAAAYARTDELTAEQRSIAITEVAEMLMSAYRQLDALPECAMSVLEQCAIVSSTERAPLDDADIAMVLARSGLVINTWCSAATLMTQATEGPMTIGGLVALLSTMQPDARYQVSLIERLTAAAYDTSAMRQLSTCYFHALEGFSLLELHKLIGMQDIARMRAVDLLDSASRGAMVAVHFLGRTPMDDTPAEEDQEDADQADVDQAPETDLSDTPEADVGRQAPDEPPAEAQPLQHEAQL